jgi:PKD repeat protein
MRSDLVESYKKPVAAFSLDRNTAAVNGAVLRFINESTGAVSYLWDFGDGSTSEEKDATHQFPKLGHRIVLLKAFNEFSCTDTISHDFMVAFEKIFTPNAFSPNAPKEIDREFRLNTDGVVPEGYHFIIISRWNDLVFEAKNEINGWDGRLRNGNMAPAGNYVWVLDYFDTSGRPHHQTGTVTLVY